jgi:hypothetical protein
VTEAVDEILGTGGGDQWLQGFESWADERAQGASLRAYFLRRAGTHETKEPRGDRRQVAPAQ